MSRAPALARTAEARNLIYASDDIVAKAIVSIESTVAAAVLLLLPTSRWARVLELAANNADIQVITEILSRMTSSQQPQEQEQLAALQTVEALLETLLQEERVSRSTVIIEELVANMETFGPRVKSALDMAQTQDERLAQEIMSRTTTFENVLMLDGDTIREFIDPYDSEQLAQIIIALNETQRREFLKHIRGRTRITVESDFRRLSGSASMRRKAAAQGRQYMSEMVAQLKDMAAQGLVEIPRIGANSKNTSRETA
jgi:flagellar motor switch protein FliG